MTKCLDVKASIPAEVLEKVQARRVVEAAFGAGPSFCAGKVDKFDPPVSLDEGLAWIQQYLHVMRRGSLFLDDRSLLVFEPLDGFVKYDPTPHREGPSPGVTVDHPSK